MCFYLFVFDSVLVSHKRFNYCKFYLYSWGLLGSFGALFPSITSIYLYHSSLSFRFQCRCVVQMYASLATQFL